MNRSKLFLVVALCVGATALFSANAHAQSGGTIYGCYSNSNGQLRRVNNPTECKSNETGLSWNVQGPKGEKGETGPRGPQGEKGETGAAGPQGPAGTNGTNGVDGRSPVGEAEPAGSNCQHGGVKYTDAQGAHYVCNGAPGGNPNTEALEARVSALEKSLTPPIAYVIVNNHTVTFLDGSDDSFGGGLTLGPGLPLNLPIGGNCVAVSPVGKRAYLGGFNVIEVVDTSTDQVIDYFPISGTPRSLAVTPDGTRLYVTYDNTSSVSVIDTATYQVINTITFDDTVQALAINPSGTRAYIVHYALNGVGINGSVSVIDTSNNSVVTTVAVGSIPREIVVNSAGTRAYVTNIGSSSVTVIDTTNNTAISSITGLNSVTGIAISPNGNRLYVSEPTHNAVAVIDTNSNAVVRFIASGLNTPVKLTVNPAGTRVYVTNGIGNTLSVIHTAFNSVIANLAVGENQRAVAFK